MSIYSPKKWVSVPFFIIPDEYDELLIEFHSNNTIRIGDKRYLISSTSPFGGVYPRVPALCAIPLHNNHRIVPTDSLDLICRDSARIKEAGFTREGFVELKVSKSATGLYKSSTVKVPVGEMRPISISCNDTSITLLCSNGEVVISRLADCRNRKWVRMFKYAKTTDVSPEMPISSIGSHGSKIFAINSRGLMVFCRKAKLHLDTIQGVVSISCIRSMTWIGEDARQICTKSARK